MLDSDLAKLYGITTSRLNEQVKRNINRFPADFMSRLNDEEFQVLISQNATSSHGGRRKLPYAFTEHGAVMLASVLNSGIAIEASIKVVRAFITMREILNNNDAIATKIKELKELMQGRFADHDKKIQILFEAIKQLAEQKTKPRQPIGYRKK
jgi:phage regulator Rha-like protein